MVCAKRGKLLSEILESVSAARKQLGQLESKLSEPCRDMAAQITDLVYEGFLEELEPGRLEHYQRYVVSLLDRLEKLRSDPAQDIAKMGRVNPWFERYQVLIHDGAIYDQDVDAFRWLIEEYRVSVFAQHLGTDGKVSEMRLAEAWNTVKQE